MKRVLIVSPSFPPVSAADLHRVRMSLPYYREFGWDPIVLAVRPDAHGGLVEPELEKSVTGDVTVVRTGAMNATVTGAVGVRAVGLRALGHLYRAGADLIRRHDIDLVFFSTTQFPVLTLGRAWRARFGTPYVIDMQDPWKSDYQGAGKPRGIKASLARTMHGVLEPLAMRRAAGIVSVSPSYIETLRRRYPSLEADACMTIPFGAHAPDIDVARATPWRNAFFDRNDGRLHGVSVGRGGRDMSMAAEVLLRACQKAPHDIALSFVGTDYASRVASKTMTPIADRLGAGSWVQESPARVPYFDALRLLLDSHFTVVLGSDDAAYRPSKVFPYLITGRPFVAVLHASSPAVDVLRLAGTGVVVTFDATSDPESLSAKLAEDLEWVVARAGQTLRVPAALRDSIGSRELTRQQCLAFNAAIRHPAPEGIPCTE